MKKCFFNIINTFKKWETKYDLLWFILIPILNINYFITSNIYTLGYNISLSIDKVIPLVPIFIFPYAFWYLFVPLGLLNLLLTDRQKYFTVFLTIIMGMIFCFIVYTFFPTQYPRPIITNNDIFSKLIKVIYSNDKPFNCLPSIHVLNTYLIMRATSYSKSKPIFIYTQVTGILIILSTIFVKQHFILDIVASIILSEILILSVSFIDKKIIDSLLLLPYRLRFKKQRELPTMVDDINNL